MNTDRFPPEYEEPLEPNQADPSAPSALCAEVERLVPAYGLGATDAEETAFIQAHLARCPDAANELTAYTELADALLYSAPVVQAPAHLANRLQMAIRQSAPAPEPTTSWWGRWQLALSRWHWSYNQLAATAVILLLLVLNFYAIQQNRNLRQQEVALANKQDQLSRALLVIMATENVKEIQLPAAQTNSEAHAEVIWNAEAGVAILYARDFPAISADKAYQLWLLRDGKRTSPGLFKVDPKGDGLLIFPIAQPLDTLQAMGITTEPVQGSPGPTSKPVVRKQFQ
ncbi:MAG: anti-sigma factor [Caldilineaceae bacterium]